MSDIAKNTGHAHELQMQIRAATWVSDGFVGVLRSPKRLFLRFSPVRLSGRDPISGKNSGQIPTIVTR